jgi:transformer-2 protein
LFFVNLKVTNVKIVVDPHENQSRGFAFISFSSVEQADEALAKLDQSDYNGKPITVQKARRSRPRTPTPGRYFGKSSRHDPYSRGRPDRRYFVFTN